MKLAFPGRCAANRAAVVFMGLLLIAATAPVKQMQQVAPAIDAVRIALTELPAGVKRTSELDAIVADLRAGNAERANVVWRKVLETQLAGRSAADVEACIDWLLQQSYLTGKGEVARSSERVRYYGKLQTAMQSEVASATRELATLKPWPRTLRAVTVPSEYVAGQPIVQSATTRSFTKTELEIYVSDLEEQLNAVGDDAQLANVDLQNLLQKQQQTLQMMSNISKMLHDTMMAVIRKIGG